MQNKTKNKATHPDSSVGILDVFHYIRIERTGLFGAVIVLLICIAISHYGWDWLQKPSNWVNEYIFLSWTKTFNCSGLQVKTFAMYLCSVKVALVTALSPILLFIFIILSLFVAKKLKPDWFQTLLKKIPSELRFLVRPLLVTILFSFFWTGIHPEKQAAELTGLVYQKNFPGLLGLFIYLVTRYQNSIHHGLKKFFVLSNKIPMPLRLLVAMLIPFSISLIITYQNRVTYEALKEQLIVLLALTLGYLALTPLMKNKNK